MSEYSIATFVRYHDRRFILAFIALLSVLFILAYITGGSAYSYSETRMYNDFSNQEQLLADIQKNVIVSELEDPVRLVAVFETNPDLQRYADSPVSKLPEVSLFLQNYINRSDYFSHVHLINPAGGLIYSYARHGDTIDETVDDVNAEQELFQRVLNTRQGGLYFSIINVDPHLLADGIKSELEIHFGIPLFTRDGKSAGAIIFGYPFDNISDVMITDDLSKTTIGYIMLLDEHGHYIYNEHDSTKQYNASEAKSEIYGIQTDFPEEWVVISQSENGQLRTENGIFTYHTIDVTSPEFLQNAGADFTINSPMSKYTVLTYLNNAKIEKLRGDFDRIYRNLVTYLIIAIPVFTYLLALLFSILVTSREKHRHQSHHDPLTGLANRTKFMERLSEILANNGIMDKHPSIAYFDLDNFKAINDTYGHAAGDAVLSKLAQNIRDAVRQDDLVSRLGGDEFVVLTVNIKSEADAYAVGERLLAAIREPIHYHNNVFSLTGSIGIWTVSDTSLDMREIITKADAAMYQAKREGKNRVVVGEV